MVSCAPGAGRKNLGFYLGFMGGVRVVVAGQWREKSWQDALLWVSVSRCTPGEKAARAR